MGLGGVIGCGSETPRLFLGDVSRTAVDLTKCHHQVPAQLSEALFIRPVNTSATDTHALAIPSILLLIR